MSRSKYTPPITSQIISLIAAGNYVETACKIAGVSKESHYTWMKLHTDYSDAVKRAEAAAEARHVQNIEKNSMKTWQASAWFLERKFPERWGRQIVIQTNDTKLDKLIEAFDAEVKRADAE